MKTEIHPTDKKNGLLLLPGFVGCLFLVLYTILSYFNRFPYEDYSYISISKDWGPINAMIHVYKVYSARWSAHTVAFSFSLLYEKAYFLFLFNLITLTVFFLSIYLVLKRIFLDLWEFNIPKTTLLAYSTLFTICFFFSSYDIGQVWFWYMVNWMYMWSIIAGNFLICLLFSKNLKLWQIPVIIVLTAYIAGAAESYALIYILLFGTLFILKKKNIFSDTTRKIESNILILTLILMLLFFMITICAPGTWARKRILTDATFAQHIVMVLKAYGKLILQTPKLIPYLLVFGLPWMLLGYENSSKEKIELKKTLPTLGKSLALIGCLIFILIVPASWILYDTMPARALSQVSLLLTTYVSLLFFYLGYKIQLPQKTIKWTAGSAIGIGTILIAFHTINQYKITSAFSNEYDSRLIRILEEKDRTRTLYFEQLPLSGMLYRDELSSDSTTNKYFENIYSPNFHVAVKKP